MYNNIVTMPKVLSRIANYFASVKFYHLIIGLFVFESVWIAVSAAYPQAFDENFHFGLIKVYSHYWLPFISHQPKSADQYGAISRLPSYLYEYSMSFPYRLIELFTKKQIIQVIILRFLNIAMLTYAIVLFRRVLLKVGTSNALTNLLLMLFVLIPIVPQLAAQINYDNLMILLTAAMLLLAFRLTDEIKAKQPSIWSISLFIGTSLLTSLVKYAFLPIFAGMILFLLVILYRSYKPNIRLFFHHLVDSWHRQQKIAKFVIVFMAIVPLGLFIQRDVVNLVLYQRIQPDCSKVLSVKRCMAYSPWAYNYKNHIKLTTSNPKLYSANPVIYLFQWLYWMWYRLFFAVNGPKSHFKNFPPFPLPSAATLIVVIAGFVALVKWWRKIFEANLYLVMLAVVAVSYLVALMGQGYLTYRYTNVLENMNGRYLLPVILLVAAILGQALSRSLRKAQNRKVIIALVVLLFFIEGGGVLTFISRSNASWDIHNKTVVKVNNVARKVVKPLLIKGSKKYHSSFWFFN